VPVVAAVSVRAVDSAALPAFSLGPRTDVFSKWEAGYFCIKIPSLLKTANALLAFAEGRRLSCSDFAETELVLKRSIDGGASWSPLRVLFANLSWPALPAPGARGGPTVVGNAAPVQLASGRVLLVFCGPGPAGPGNAGVYVSSSDDEGATWAAPRAIGAGVDASWTWVGTGPPAALALRGGRVLVPSYHSQTAGDDGELSTAHALLSDDGGASWFRGGEWAAGPNFPNENSAVALPNGTVWMHARGLFTSRWGSLSADGGVSWAPAAEVAGLVQPLGGCQGATAAYGAALLFSGPLETSPYRSNLTLCVASAEGPGALAFIPALVINRGPSAYSALAVGMGAAGADVGVLFERSNRTLLVFEPDVISFQVLLAA
jgi:sialidase-1